MTLRALLLPHHHPNHTKPHQSCFNHSFLPPVFIAPDPLRTYRQRCVILCFPRLNKPCSSRIPKPSKNHRALPQAGPAPSLSATCFKTSSSGDCEPSPASSPYIPVIFPQCLTIAVTSVTFPPFYHGQGVYSFLICTIFFLGI